MTLPVPFRLLVLQKLTEKLQAITPAHGYHFDLTSAVFRGRTWFSDDDPLPMISLLEPPFAIDQNRTQADNTDRTGDWEILIQGWVEDDSANPTDPAYVLAAEVIKALADSKKEIRTGTRTSDIFGLGAGFGDRDNAITALDIGAPVVRPADDVSARACFYLLVTFKIAEDMSAPFS